jgi:hypothetical protein
LLAVIIQSPAAAEGAFTVLPQDLRVAVQVLPFCECSAIYQVRRRDSKVSSADDGLCAPRARALSARYESYRIA